MSLTISPARIVEESGSPLLAARESWERRPLGEVATILNGFAFKSKQFVSEGGKPLIRIRDIFSEKTVVGYVGDYDSRYVVQPGDLLVGMDGDFNCARWRGPEALLNQRVCKITPDSEQLNLNFLIHLLPGYLRAIHDLTSSTTVTHLSSRDVAQIPIPVPSLEEQHELAQLFEGAASKQQSSTRHLVVARRVISRFRQAVLMAACSGRLTADWREQRELRAMSDLLADLREKNNGRRTSVQPPNTEMLDELPTTWAWACVGEIGEVQLGGTPSRKDASYWDGGVPWVSSGEVANCRISSTRETITEAGLANSSAKLYPAGTVLIAMIGEGKTRGQSAILDIEASTNQNAAGVVPDREVVSPEYVWLWALAQYEVTRAVGRGGNQPALNGQKVRELTIPVPPLEEQREIVRRVDQLLAVADGLRQRIDVASTRVDRSFQAVLAKAFRGDLTPARAGPQCE
jgi:type I restriction enzyme S subunit